jgi:hypothetical protein
LVPAGTFATNGGSNTRRGWTVGGGIEWAFNQNGSVAGEHRHTDFGNRATTFDIPDGLGGIFVNFEFAADRPSGASQLPLQLRRRTGGGALLIVALSGCTEERVTSCRAFSFSVEHEWHPSSVAASKCSHGYPIFLTVPPLYRRPLA